MSSRQALGPPSALFKWEARENAPGVEQVGREADHSHRLRADMKNEWSFIYLQVAQRKLYVGTVNFIVTYLLTPWSGALLQMLTGLQLVKKFPAFYGTQRFITAVTSARHLSLS